MKINSVISAEKLQDLGKKYIKEKNLKEALIVLKKSYSLDEKNPWTALYLGNVFYHYQDYDEAINWFEISCQLVNDLATPYWCLAECYEKKGEHKMADFNYRKAVKTESNSKEAKTKLEAWLRRKV